MKLASLLLLAACSDPASATAPDASTPPPDIDAAPIDGPDGCPRLTPLQWSSGGDNTAAVRHAPDGSWLLYGYGGADLAQEPNLGRNASGYVRAWGEGRFLWGYNVPHYAGESVDAVEFVNDKPVLVGRVFHDDGRADLFVTELDRGGNETSHSVVGMMMSEHPTAFLVEGDARAIVGYHETFIPTNYVEAYEDPFVYRWNASQAPTQGEFTRAKTERPDIVTGGVFTSDGQLVVSGHALTGSTGSYLTPVDDFFGQPVQGHPGNGDTFRALHRIAGGDVIVAGTTSHALGAHAFGSTDAFVARLSPDLTTTRWLTQIGTIDVEEAIDLAVDDEGRSWLVGTTLGDLAGHNEGLEDLFVTALAPDGAIRWQQQRGSHGQDLPTSIAVDACDQVVVAGSTNGDLVGTHHAGFDAFALTL